MNIFSCFYYIDTHIFEKKLLYEDKFQSTDVKNTS